MKASPSHVWKIPPLQQLGTEGKLGGVNGGGTSKSFKGGWTFGGCVLQRGNKGESLKLKARSTWEVCTMEERGSWEVGKMVRRTHSICRTSPLSEQVKLAKHHKKNQKNNEGGVG